MTYIVHWKDVVEKNFGSLERFKGIILDGVNKLSQEEKSLYDKTRWFMRRCGYEERGKEIIRTHGWFTPYYEDGELKFMCTADKTDRTLITLPQYMEYWTNKDLANMEDEYYNTQVLVRGITDNITMPKSRKDLDGDDEGGLIG